MVKPEDRDIGQGGRVTLLTARSDDAVLILGFHGGGGVDGSPAMMVPFCQQVTNGPGITVALARYRTLNRDGARLEHMRADAAHALDWAMEQAASRRQLYLMGASFGGFLALDALMEAPPETRTKVAGLILLNPVTNTGRDGFSNRVVRAKDHAKLSPLTRYARHPMLRQLRCFMAHGGRDDVVPIEATHRFAALWPQASPEVMVFPNSTHGFFNRAPHGATVAAAVRRFVGAPDCEISTTTPPPKPAAPPRPARGSDATQAGLLPQGATMVYGIGAQKAGTSWLFDCLGQSAECHTVPTKELHYFDALYVRNERGHLTDRLSKLQQVVARLKPGVEPDNLKLLRQAKLLVERLSIHATAPGDHAPYVRYMTQGYGGEKIICDFTPSYCTLDTDGFQEMARVGPAKFIFILRDPVDRLWSQIRMSISENHGKLSDAAYVKKCAAHAQRLCDTRNVARIPRADYARTMAALEAAVPATQIKYVFYETLFQQKTVDEICTFLDIPPVHVAAEKRVNLGRSTSLPKAIEDKLASALAPQYEAARARFGGALPSTWL